MTSSGSCAAARRTAHAIPRSSRRRPPRRRRPRGRPPRGSPRTRARKTPRVSRRARAGPAAHRPAARASGRAAADGPPVRPFAVHPFEWARHAVTTCPITACRDQWMRRTAVAAGGRWGMTFSAGRDAQSEIYRAGAAGRRPRIPVGFAQLEREAQRRMSRAAFAYVAGSAGLERTAEANLEAFRRRRIVPRVLRDVSARDLSVELFGVRRPSPLLLAPIGVLELARRGGDAAAARAAAALGVPAVLSTQASQPMEEVAAAMDAVAPGAARWFQLYWSSSRELVASLVSRAERSGCEAIVVTLDTHVLGWRPRDLALGYLPFSR